MAGGSTGRVAGNHRLQPLWELVEQLRRGHDELDLQPFVLRQLRNLLRSHLVGVEREHGADALERIELDYLDYLDDLLDIQQPFLIGEHQLAVVVELQLVIWLQLG